MESRDMEQFVTLITALASSFGREADEATLTGYKIGLQDLPIEVVESAVGNALRKCKFMPVVAELRELAGVMTPQARAITAWDAFAQASKHYGYYDTVSFDDPVINATIRNLGGWQRLSSIDDRKEFEVFLRKDFERVYTSLYQNGITSEMSAPLVGYFDEQNALNGYELRSVKQIASGLPPSTARISAAPDRRPLGLGVLKRVDDENQTDSARPIAAMHACVPQPGRQALS